MTDRGSEFAGVFRYMQEVLKESGPAGAPAAWRGFAAAPDGDLPYLSRAGEFPAQIFYLSSPCIEDY